jgi:hypothetical protein
MEVQLSGKPIRIAEILKRNDGEEGPLFSFTHAVHQFGFDEDGEPITVGIVSGEDVSAQSAAKGSEPKLSANQRTMFAILHNAGPAGLSTEDWNDLAKEEGIGVKRHAALYDIRSSLMAKGLVRQYGKIWKVNHS